MRARSWLRCGWPHGHGRARARCLRGAGRQDRRLARGSGRAHCTDSPGQRRGAAGARRRQPAASRPRGTPGAGRPGGSRQTGGTGYPIDAILLDAPCSGTGVIRRHPDIKLLRRASDIAEFARGRARCCAPAGPLLRRGGRLLYATCSVLPAENAAVVAAILVDNARGPRAATAGSPGCSSRCVHASPAGSGSRGQTATASIMLACSKE